jgi:hypothetical protein
MTMRAGAMRTAFRLRRPKQIFGGKSQKTASRRPFPKFEYVFVVSDLRGNSSGG